MALSSELTNAFARVLKKGTYILGDEVRAFEREFAAYLDVPDCVGVGNGTDALALALRGVGVEPGDEVITVANSAVATVAAIEQIGAVPVLADVDRRTRCLDPRYLEPLIRSATKAIVPVHLFGQPADMAEIVRVGRAHRLAIVEDCAQAHGAHINGKKVGSLGDAAAFSFYPTKNLGAIGDGGVVASPFVEVMERVRAMRQYGWFQRRVSERPGVNSRLDEVQAAILRVKLPRLHADTARRRAIAQRYTEAVTGSGITVPPSVPQTCHAYHLFVVESDARQRLRQYLDDKGVCTAIHYPSPIHQHPAYQGRLRGHDRLRVTEELSAVILSLPLYPEMPEEYVEQVCCALRSWTARRSDG